MKRYLTLLVAGFMLALIAPMPDTRADTPPTFTASVSVNSTPLANGTPDVVGTAAMLTVTPAIPASAFATQTALAGTSTPTPPALLGYTKISGGGWDTGDGNSLSVVRVTTGIQVNVSSMSAYVGPLDSTRGYGLAIYTNTGGVPGTLVASATGTLTTANGWNSLPLTATLLPNTRYWLAYNTVTTSQTLNTVYLVQSGSVPGGWSGTVVCCSFPLSVGGWTMHPPYQYALYVSVN